jgi:hypothetical protein
VLVRVGTLSHAAPSRLNHSPAQTPPTVSAAPRGQSRRRRALFGAAILAGLIAFSAVLALAVSDSRLTLPAAILLAVLAVGATATAMGLALCRTAAAADRSLIDAKRAAASEWAKGQRVSPRLGRTRPMTEI